MRDIDIEFYAESLFRFGVYSSKEKARKEAKRFFRKKEEGFEEPMKAPHRPDLGLEVNFGEDQKKDSFQASYICKSANIFHVGFCYYKDRKIPVFCNTTESYDYLFILADARETGSEGVYEIYCSIDRDDEERIEFNESFEDSDVFPRYITIGNTEFNKGLQGLINTFLSEKFC